MMINKILFSLLGGLLSRMVGGGKPNLLIPAQWLYALPYGMIFMGTWYGLPAYACSAIGKRIGHFPYFLLGHYTQAISNRPPSPVEPIVRFFFGLDKGGQYWRDFFGLTLTGLAVTIVPGILYGLVINPLAGLLLALSGAFKSIAYAIGWKFKENYFGIEPTAIGEILTGIMTYGVLSCLF